MRIKYEVSAGGLVLRRRESTYDALLIGRGTPRVWTLPKGHVEARESYEQAALREVREETGFLADHGLTDSGVINRYPIHRAWLAKFAAGTKENVEHVFSWSLPAIDAVRLDPHEHLEYRWLPRDEAVKFASSNTDRDAILKLVPEVSEG